MVNKTKLNKIKEGYYWVKQYNHFDIEIMKFEDGYFTQFGNCNRLLPEELSFIGDKIVNSWIDVKYKEAPFQSEILFKTKNGAVYAGIRFIPTTRSNPVYQDFKKNKLRKNVIKWQFMPE
jgi:hypothetical protein